MPPNWARMGTSHVSAGMRALAPHASPLGVELAWLSVGSGTVAPDPTTADATEQPAQKIDSVSPARTAAPAIGSPDLPDPSPQLV
jgi:hypothetical protein